MRTFVVTVAGILIASGVLVTAQCSNTPVETSSPVTAQVPEVPPIIQDLVAANRHHRRSGSRRRLWTR